MTKKFTLSLLVLTLIGLISACTADESAQEYPPVGASDIPSYQIVVPADDIASGSPRIPFIIYDGFDQVSTIDRVTINAYALQDDGNGTLVWSGEAQPFNDYAVPYWVTYPELPTAGLWGLEATIVNADGVESEAQFAVQTVDDTEGPQIGELPPASINRTLETVDDVKLLSSAVTPDPALHQFTVAELLDNGRPSVISFNTPAYCQTAVCAPVLNSIEQSHETYNQDVDYLHLEIFKEFDPLTTADEVLEWNLTSEPWTFVLDEDGRVAARLAGPVSPVELQFHIENILNE